MVRIQPGRKPVVNTRPVPRIISVLIGTVYSPSPNISYDTAMSNARFSHFKRCGAVRQDMTAAHGHDPGGNRVASSEVPCRPKGPEAAYLGF